MRYFAKIENDNLVSQVIVLDDTVKKPEQFIKDLGLEGPWMETFEDGGKRVNFASVGYTYDKVRDMFIQNKPEHGDVVFDEQLGRWQLKTASSE